jgi:hypothetical protein
MPAIWDVACGIILVQTVLRSVDKWCLVTAGRTKATVEQHETIGLKVNRTVHTLNTSSSKLLPYDFELSVFCLWKTHYFLDTYNGALLCSGKILNVIPF